MALFYEAVCAQDLAQMRHWLAQGTDPDEYRTRTGQTALHHAASMAGAAQHPEVAFEVVELLLEMGADPNCLDEQNGLTPLHLAAGSNSLMSCKLLVDYGATASSRLPPLPSELATDNQVVEFLQSVEQRQEIEQWVADAAAKKPQNATSSATAGGALASPKAMLSSASSRTKSFFARFLPSSSSSSSSSSSQSSFSSLISPRLSKLSSSARKKKREQAAEADASASAAESLSRRSASAASSSRQSQIALTLDTLTLSSASYVAGGVVLLDAATVFDVDFVNLLPSTTPFFSLSRLSAIPLFHPYVTTNGTALIRCSETEVYLAGQVRIPIPEEGEEEHAAGVGGGEGDEGDGDIGLISDSYLGGSLSVPVAVSLLQALTNTRLDRGVELIKVPVTDARSRGNDGDEHDGGSKPVAVTMFFQPADLEPEVWYQTIDRHFQLCFAVGAKRAQIAVYIGSQIERKAIRDNIIALEHENYDKKVRRAGGDGAQGALWGPPATSRAGDSAAAAGRSSTPGATAAGASIDTAAGTDEEDGLSKKFDDRQQGRDNAGVVDVTEAPIKMAAVSGAHVPAPPPLPPPLGGARQQQHRTKRLYWKTIPANQLQTTIWGMSSGDGDPQLNEEELLQAFAVAAAHKNILATAASGASSTAAARRSLHYDNKRLQEIEILRRRFANLSDEQLVDAVNRVAEPFDRNEDAAQSLVGLLPSDSEAARIAEFFKAHTGALADESDSLDDLPRAEQFHLIAARSLGTAATPLKARFLVARLAFPQVIRASLDNVFVMRHAMLQVRTSDELRRVLRLVLQLGNALNSHRGKASGVSLTGSLPLLTSVKTDGNSAGDDDDVADGKRSLLDYLVKSLDRELVEAFPASLSLVHFVTDVSFADLHRDDLRKDVAVARKLNKLLGAGAAGAQQSTPFSDAVHLFISEAAPQLAQFELQLSQCQQLFAEVLGFFGESAAVTERDFFSVCSRFVRDFSDAAERLANSIETE